MRFAQFPVRTTLLTVVVAVFAIVAQAEERDFRRWGGRGLQDLAQISFNEAVQQEIGATDEQKTQLRTLRSDYSRLAEAAWLEKGLDKGMGSIPESIGEYNQKCVDLLKSTREQLEPRLAGILSDDQRLRLDEILVQARGPVGITDAKTAAALHLTEKQLATLAAIHAEHVRKLQDVFADENARTAIDRHLEVLEIEKSRNADILIVLTAEQQEAFERLQGKPFDLSQVRNAAFSNGVFGPRATTSESAP